MAIFLWERPSRICDQHFGQEINMEELVDAIMTPVRISSQYTRPWKSVKRSASRQDTGSKITLNNEGFHVSLDVQHFTPEEVSVKVVGNDIIVEAKHEEREDDHGTISRHFVRRYVLPEGHSPDDIVSKLSSDGQLTITAPKKKIPQTEERVIPIKLTDTPRQPQKDIKQEKTSPPPA